MNNNERDARLVADYKQLASDNRARRRAQMSSAAQLSSASTVTVILRFAPNAKPVSELGGPTKTFGPSSINIPEFRRQKQP